jgi:hypothetical protein
MWLYINHDRIELIDRPDVAERADEACASMRAELAQMATSGTGSAEIASRVRQENEVVRRFVQSVRALGRPALKDDSPAEAWLRDWENLVAARDHFAYDLIQGTTGTAPTVPTVNGVPIIKRMNEVGIACRVPSQIVDDFARR